MTMVCDLCGKTGIRWMGPLSNLTHTECPHCGGRNCQRADCDDEDSEEDERDMRERLFENGDYDKNEYPEWFGGDLDA